MFPRFHFQQRLQQGQGRTLKVRIPKILADHLPTLNFSRVRLVIIRVTHFFGVPHLPQRPSPAASTWMTDVDLLVRLRKLVTQVLPFHSLGALCGWPDKLGANPRPQAVTPHLLAPALAVVMKERSVPASLSRSVISAADRLQVLLVVVRLHQPHWLIRDVQPALLLQTFEYRFHKIVPALLQVGQQFVDNHEVLARMLRWRVSPKHFRLALCSGRRMQRTTIFHKIYVHAFECSCSCSLSVLVDTHMTLKIQLPR